MTGGAGDARLAAAFALDTPDVERRYSGNERVALELVASGVPVARAVQILRKGRPSRALASVLGLEDPRTEGRRCENVPDAPRRTPSAGAPEPHGEKVSHGDPDCRLCPRSEAKIRPYRCRRPECLSGTCRRFAAVGLNDEGRPLPKPERPTCGAKRRDGGECQAKVVPGKRRCRMHGGLSTGPKSKEGWAKLRAGHARWRSGRGAQAR